MIPIIITARKQSQRCINKLLRHFHIDSGQSLSLLDICLSKLKGNPDAFLAGFESEFKDLAKKYEINFLQRTKESSLSEDPLIIHSHLENNFDYVCLLNPCCPMVKKSTILAAIETFNKLEVKSLFTVKESNELIFDSSEKVVNNDRVFNSKLRRPNYIGNNVLLIFNVQEFFKTGTYWSYTRDDPRLFIMNELESIDIDTELDFIIARTIYQHYG